MKNQLPPAASSRTQRENSANVFTQVREELNLSQKELADQLNTSLFALVRWERGDLTPSPEILERLRSFLSQDRLTITPPDSDPIIVTFASTGARDQRESLPLFDPISIDLLSNPRLSLIPSLTDGELWGSSELALADILSRRHNPARTRESPVDEEVSAGKNTYTYDAHTYHTKVPPQGIARVISQYLPNGGVVLDPFAGSGMTGVAARYLGMDAILNELSPAASFIAYNFTQKVDPAEFNCAVEQLLFNLRNLRECLYRTRCRECGRNVEAQFIVWSYQLECNHCLTEFTLWDHCRQYGRTVREHKLLKKFPCPNCNKEITKSYLRRLDSVPVFLGYRCCKAKIMEHHLDEHDFALIDESATMVHQYSEQIPNTVVPDGVNLSQPKRHGLDTIQSFYTPRNLTACAAIWAEIKRIDDPRLASAVGFVFTSLYKRVTRLSEYRFWGGSGNTANFNVPQIWNESNVFITFERKAKSIADHFVTTAQSYRGRCAVRTGSATDLSYLPDNSVDFVFTDPPFGSNINYSEMNLLWEAWLGDFTQSGEEAIISRVQGKTVDRYQKLMTQSLAEAYRVLRPGHWMVLVFMNSSDRVWHALQASIYEAGFSIDKVAIFDKQHGTFKQFVSENTAGSDLMLHCQKPENNSISMPRSSLEVLAVPKFMEGQVGLIPLFPYLHVSREIEVDYRTLYSRYIAKAIRESLGVVSFAEFRNIASNCVETLV